MIIRICTTKVQEVQSKTDARKGSKLSAQAGAPGFRQVQRPRPAGAKDLSPATMLLPLQGVFSYRIVFPGRYPGLTAFYPLGAFLWWYDCG